MSKNRLAHHLPAPVPIPRRLTRKPKTISRLAGDRYIRNDEASHKTYACISLKQRGNSLKCELTLGHNQCCRQMPLHYYILSYHQSSNSFLYLLQTIAPSQTIFAAQVQPKKCVCASVASVLLITLSEHMFTR